MRGSIAIARVKSSIAEECRPFAFCTLPRLLYAAAYRAVAAADALTLEAWVEPLHVGETLPAMPLWIAADRSVPLDLEETYQMACAARRIA